MKEIKLNSVTFLVAIIDDEDYERVIKHNWIIHRGKKVYARAKINGKYVSLHDLILNNKNKALEADHKDGNGLNCRRENLRLGTHQQNIANRQKYKEGSSRFKGVYFNKERRNFQSQIMVRKKQIYLGRYQSEEEAALVYNKAATKYFGEFAVLNEVK